MKFIIQYIFSMLTVRKIFLLLSISITVETSTVIEIQRLVMTLHLSKNPTSKRLHRNVYKSERRETKWLHIMKTKFGNSNSAFEYVSADTYFKKNMKGNNLRWLRCKRAQNMYRLGKCLFLTRVLTESILLSKCFLTSVCRNKRGETRITRWLV